MLQSIQSLPLTFYSAPFYRDLLTRWRGIGLGFLLCIVLFQVGEIGVRYGSYFAMYFAEREAIVEALPEVQVKDGVLSINKPSPYTVTIFEHSEDGATKFVFDTETTFPNDEELTKRLESEKIMMLVGKTEVVTFDSEHKRVKRQDVARGAESAIKMKDWEIMSQVFPAVLGVFFVFFLFAGHLLSAFLGAILIMVVSPLFKLDPSFASSLRLSAAAKVPVAVIFLVAKPLMLLKLLIWFGFCSFGLLSARKAPT